MRKLPRVAWVGSAVLVFAVGCEVEQSLGDVPMGGAAGKAVGGSAGSTSQPGKGGNGTGGTAGAVSGGSGGAAAGRNAGGAGPVAGTTGHAGSGPAAGSGGAISTGGTGGVAGDDAGGDGGEGGGDTWCVGPDNPTLADAPGCPCEPQPGVCVAIDNGIALSLWALDCVNGYWERVNGGACGALVGRSCLVGDRIYHDGEAVPDPYSTCNTCRCEAGKVTGCTEIACDAPCAEGTEPQARCRECGQAGGCTIIETGCFEPCDQTCTLGFCLDGLCQVGPCD